MEQKRAASRNQAAEAKQQPSSTAPDIVIKTHNASEAKTAAATTGGESDAAGVSALQAQLADLKKDKTRLEANKAASEKKAAAAINRAAQAEKQMLKAKAKASHTEAMVKQYMVRHSVFRSRSFFSWHVIR